MENLLDKLFKTKLKSRTSKFDPTDWENMEAMLDGKKSNRRLALPWLNLAALVSFVLIALFNFYHLNNDKTQPYDSDIDIVLKGNSQSSDLAVKTIDSNSQEKTNSLDNQIEVLEEETLRPLSQFIVIESDYKVKATGETKEFTEVDQYNPIEQLDNDELTKELSNTSLAKQLVSINKISDLPFEEFESHSQLIPAPSMSQLKPVLRNELSRPSLGVSLAHSRSTSLSQFEVGLFSFKPLTSRVSLFVLGNYSFIESNPFFVAEELGNIYSFDVSNYEQTINGKSAHSVSAFVGISYSLPKLMVTISIQNQYLLALKSERFVTLADEEETVDEIWTDKSLYKNHLMGLRLSYDYSLTNHLMLGGFVNSGIYGSSNLNPSNLFGINLKWTL